MNLFLALLMAILASMAVAAPSKGAQGTGGGGVDISIGPLVIRAGGGGGGGGAGGFYLGPREIPASNGYGAGSESPAFIDVRAGGGGSKGSGSGGGGGGEVGGYGGGFGGVSIGNFLRVLGFGGGEKGAAGAKEGHAVGGGGGGFSFGGGGFGYGGGEKYKTLFKRQVEISNETSVEPTTAGQEVDTVLNATERAEPMTEPTTTTTEAAAATTTTAGSSVNLGLTGGGGGGAMGGMNSSTFLQDSLASLGLGSPTGRFKAPGKDDEDKDLVFNYDERPKYDSHGNAITPMNSRFLVVKGKYSVPDSE